MKQVQSEALQTAQHLVNHYGVKASDVGRVTELIALAISYAQIAAEPGIAALERDRTRLEHLAALGEMTPAQLRAEIDVSMAAEAAAAKSRNRRGRKAKA